LYFDCEGRLGRPRLVPQPAVARCGTAATGTEAPAGVHGQVEIRSLELNVHGTSIHGSAAVLSQVECACCRDFPADEKAMMAATANQQAALLEWVRPAK
jgi:hypothetical protein